jgi:flavin-dependent dehydrogenase
VGERLVADVVVIGAGPAGSTLAARLVQLGFDVVLLEREEFPRPRLGESLTPGVLPLLRLTGADQRVAAAGFPPVESVLVDWEDGPRERREGRAQGVLVDRGRFDLLLLDHARSLGARVLQPAAVSNRDGDGERWALQVDCAGQSLRVDAAYLAVAGGRGRGIAPRRTPTGPRTVSLYAYWHTGERSLRPRVQALDDSWCWSVPLPGGSANVLVFVDPERLRASRSAEACYHELVGESAIARDLDGARLAGPVRAADATPFHDARSATAGAIKVGDAAVSVDPISSSGVQRAVQTALAGAVVVNTILRRPADADVARRYYRNSLRRASDRHRAWAAAHYAAAATRRASPFWTRRARRGPAPATPARTRDLPLAADAPLALSRETAFVDLPCVAGEFVEPKTAVDHPALEEPVAYLGGWELAPLLQRLPAGATARDLARAWASFVPESAGVAITGWLTSSGILVSAGERA